ncbi:hypothetical protein BH11CYA1_BH11CYA1_11080 [soil metagenome]
MPKSLAKNFLAWFSDIGWVVISCLVPLIVLLVDLLKHFSNLSSNLAMRIMGARLMVGGEVLYADFWDWTQPCVFYGLRQLLLINQSVTPLVDAFRSIGWQGMAEFLALLQIPEVFILLVILFSFVCSIVLAGTIAFFASGQERKIDNSSGLYLIAASVSALTVRHDFGDLQFLLLVGLIPWIILRYVRYTSSASVPLWLSILTGIIAGSSACIEITFLPLYLLLEVAFLGQTKKWRALLQPESIGLLLMPALYLCSLLTASESFKMYFWKWTMPLRLLQYSVDNESIFSPISTPRRTDVLYAALIALSGAALFARNNALVSVLGALLLSGIYLFWLEGEGYSHDLILAIFASTAIGVYCLEIVFKKLIQKLRESGAAFLPGPLMSKAGLVAATVLATVVAFMLVQRDRSLLMYEDYRLATEGKISINQTIRENSRPGDRVAVVADYNEAGYPDLLALDRRPGLYLLSFRALRLFDWLKEHERLDGDFKTFYQYIYEELRAGINSGTTNLIIVSDAWDSQIFEKEKITELLDRFYEHKDGVVFFDSYQNSLPHEYVGLEWGFNVYKVK